MLSARDYVSKARLGGKTREPLSCMKCILTLGSKFINLTGLTLSERTCHAHG